MNQELEGLVYRAEEMRVSGNLREAIALAREYAEISPEDISNIPPEVLNHLMQLWRIWTVSLMSLHKREWNGNRAAELLLQAQHVFQTFYNHPATIEAAQEMPQDSQGAEYEMRAEMCRDEGRFCLYWAALTGNSSFLKEAIECFNQAIEATREGSSARGVATMEREIARRQKGEQINWEVFSDAYRIVVDLSPQAGGWDRKAAVSWWYAKEALLAGRGANLTEGLNNLRSACQEGEVNWISRYPLRELSAFILGISRRITYSLPFPQG